MPADGNKWEKEVVKSESVTGKREEKRENRRWKLGQTEQHARAFLVHCSSVLVSLSHTNSSRTLYPVLLASSCYSSSHTINKKRAKTSLASRDRPNPTSEWTTLPNYYRPTDQHKQSVRSVPAIPPLQLCLLLPSMKEMSIRKGHETMRDMGGNWGTHNNDDTAADAAAPSFPSEWNLNILFSHRHLFFSFQ